MRTSLIRLAGVLLFVPATVFAFPLVRRSDWSKSATTPNGDVSFTLGNVTYLANLQYPKASLKTSSVKVPEGSELVPCTVIAVKESPVTGTMLKDIVASYEAGDDVFSMDFLEGVYLTLEGSHRTAKLEKSAIEYLESLSPSFVLLDSTFGSSVHSSDLKSFMSVASHSKWQSLPAGPYMASVGPKSIGFNMVLRLYPDSFRDFLYGAYDSNDGAGTFNSLQFSYPNLWDPLIPVPSRIYSWSDSRPLAGARVAIKDLFDMKGLVTSGGSQAYARITPLANTTAPAIQRIVDQGGILIGKYKLAQFASGADPWDWQDEHYPFNPRGDGYLTCSASSSGGGCSVAAYDWLDFAIGSDTGSSMRRPGAVSGVYANRPSQGMITLDNVIPLGAATDTSGVFSRNVRDWVHFAKNWYTPDLIQDPSITGLSPLVVPDTKKFPKKVLYLTDYLPLVNPAAEEILQGFLANMTSLFDMKEVEVSFGALVNKSSPTIDELSSSIGTIDSITQYDVIGKPLVAAWGAMYDGRYPPLDPAHRNWHDVDPQRYSQEAYNSALKTKRAGVDWFEKNLLYSTKESCSESIMVWDIGTGGLPSFREEDLITNNTAAAFLAQVPARAVVSGASICPIFGCVDMTIPIGQVTYNSNVTFHTEYMPVTVSVIAKRGCDFMLWNMWEKMADEGMLQTINTGQTAF